MELGFHGNLEHLLSRLLSPGVNKRIFRLSPDISALILAKTADFGNSKIMLRNNLIYKSNKILTDSGLVRKFSDASMHYGC
ncbi:uncharacterized protein METZ01_LOCUS479892 [marine metagenome]|uniref:Uncharacterized protein n=1 Tax=marine metagenome TaxID=408172 RepID=A0A383C617_9ZZZZ